MTANQIFLSYSLADSDTARQIVQAIEARGWPISWERYESADSVVTTALREALNASACAVVLWSRHSIQASDVIEEATIARARGIIVQAALDEASIPMPFVLDEPTRLTDEWSIGALVRQVARVLDGEPTPRAEHETDAESDELSPRLLEQAEAHADAGALGQAIALYERWISERPEDMKAVRRLGDLFLSADARPKPHRTTRKSRSTMRRRVFSYPPSRRTGGSSDWLRSSRDSRPVSRSSKSKNGTRTRSRSSRWRECSSR